jgi:hypothetical protein
MSSGFRREANCAASESVAMRHDVGVRRAVVDEKVAAEAERCSISRLEDMVLVDAVVCAFLALRVEENKM